MLHHSEYLTLVSTSFLLKYHLPDHAPALCRWKAIYKDAQPKLDRAEFERRLTQLGSLSPARGGYCSSCGSLLLPGEWSEHEGHHVRRDVGVEEPTKLLSPMEDRKAQAVRWQEEGGRLEGNYFV